MKRNIAKMFTLASVVVATILIMILVVTAFGGINVDDFDNTLVRGLLITLAIVYVLLSVVSLTLLFIRSDILKDVVVKVENGGTMRLSAQIIKKHVKLSCSEIEGVKCKKVTIIQDDYGVRLKVEVKVVNKNTVECEIALRTRLEARFIQEFQFKFVAIEIKVSAYKTKSKLDENKIKDIVDARIAEANANMPEMEVPEQVQMPVADSYVEQPVYDQSYAGHNAYDHDAYDEMPSEVMEGHNSEDVPYGEVVAERKRKPAKVE